MNILLSILKKPIVWLIIIAAVAILYYRHSSNFKVEKQDKIEETEMDITSIKEIAEWEFLNIQREEFLDTTLKRGNVQLARIYTGTLRLGLNMKHARKDWATRHNDTVQLYLPAIELLDRDFIDESNTRTFHESGKITPELKESLYEKAKLVMKAKALTPENISIAEHNAKDQFTYMFKSLGFKTVVISMNECIE